MALKNAGLRKFTSQFVSEYQDKFLDMILVALKSVDVRNNQSFPTDLRKVTMARELAHYLAVSSAKKVPASCGDFSGEITYGLFILPYCHSVLVECIAMPSSYI